MLGKGLYEVVAGKEWSWDGQGREFCKGEYIDKVAGLLGGIVGGGLVGRGFYTGREYMVPGRPFGLERIAPFGNRTGNKYGEYPHFHRRVAHPNPSRAAKGESAPGQGIGNHRPYEAGW